MAGSFLRPFLVGFAISAVLFAALGLLAKTVLFRAPLERYQSRGWSFEIPKDWSCVDEDGDAVCRPNGLNNAIMIGATKTVGLEDNMAAFRAHIESPVRVTYANGPEFSQVLSVLTIQVRGETWLDARHRNSEILGYDTRYLVGRVGAVSVLVTFSCRTPDCEPYDPVFERAVASIAPRQP